MVLLISQGNDIFLFSFTSYCGKDPYALLTIIHRIPTKSLFYFISLKNSDAALLYNGDPNILGTLLFSFDEPIYNKTLKVRRNVILKSFLLSVSSNEIILNLIAFFRILIFRNPITFITLRISNGTLWIISGLCKLSTGAQINDFIQCKTLNFVRF